MSANPTKALRVVSVAYAEYLWDPRVRGEAEALAGAGFDVHVIAVRPETGRTQSVVNGVHIHEVPLIIRRGGRLRYVYQYAMFLLQSLILILRLALKERVDLVHVHSLPDFQVFVAAPLRLRGIPVILDLHEAMPEIVAARFHLHPQAPLVRVAVIVERLSSGFASCVIAANGGIRAALLARGTEDRKIRTVYNSGEASVEKSSSGDIRRRLGLSDVRLLVHAGGINEERDLETLLRAAKQLRSSVDVHLAIAGSGDAGYVSSLRAEATRLGIGEVVHFVGRLPRKEALELMAESEVGLVTLKSNPLTQLAFPTRVVEFANLGKAVIVPDLKFLHSVLADRARYYAPEDQGSLAAILLALLTDKSELERATGKSREIPEMFSWTHQREVLLTTYQELLGGSASLG